MRTQPTRLIAAVFALGMLTFSLGSANADELLAGGGLQELMGGGGGSQPAPATPTPPQTPQGLTDANLESFLKAAGYQPKDLGNGMFEITIKSGTWTAPIVVDLSKDETTLWLTLNLVTLSDQTSVPADKMLALLAANDENGVGYFQYVAKVKKLQLTLPMPNAKMTTGRLKMFANHMVERVIKTEALWNPAKWGANGGVAAKHVGSWVATTQKMSYRLTLNADGTFTLATRTHQGTNTSTGRFTLNGNLLTLQAGDGDTLKATMLWTAADTFVFKIEGSQGNALTFKRG